MRAPTSNSARPRIAVLGASNDRRKYGNKCVRAYASAGWTVYPVNLHETEIEDHRTYRTLADVPGGHLDRISVYLPPDATLAAVEEIADRGADEVWLNPGAADRRVLTVAAEQSIPVHDGCSIVDIGLSPSQFP